MPLPCPLSAGWQVISRTALPRRHPDGRRMGGFSALAMGADSGSGDRPLWLLSDTDQPELIPLLGWMDTPRYGPRLRLRGADGALLAPRFDGEGLVRIDGSLWIVSEGRRRLGRPPALLRFDLASGRFREKRPLPRAWRPAPDAGLRSNQGPESLARWGEEQLLVGAESPLKQDRDDRVRLARLRMEGSGIGPAPPAQPLRPLALQPRSANWGLTELLPLPRQDRLLALVRGYDPLQGWWARLQLYRLPGPVQAPDRAAPLQPLMGWDLLADLLPADNWEGMTPGPPLPDGRATLLLLSDDNFSTRQRSWLVRLAPRRRPGCGAVAPGHLDSEASRPPT
ncbi:esterase-like activity of phytase family protein [Synechococcus sp. RSCCF101]|nr:esterase-like activity of phytase family protein [Synechococcus sp. RSCCF101]